MLMYERDSECLTSRTLFYMSIGMARGDEAQAYF